MHPKAVVNASCPYRTPLSAAPAARTQIYGPVPARSPATLSQSDEGRAGDTAPNGFYRDGHGGTCHDFAVSRITAVDCAYGSARLCPGFRGAADECVALAPVASCPSVRGTALSYLRPLE